MRKAILAAALALAFVAPPPGYAQRAAPVPTDQAVVATTVEAEPIPVPEQKNAVSPGSFAATTAGVGIVVIGIVLLAGVAFLPSP